MTDTLKQDAEHVNERLQIPPATQQLKQNIEDEFMLAVGAKEEHVCVNSFYFIQFNHPKSSTAYMMYYITIVSWLVPRPAR